MTNLPNPFQSAICPQVAEQAAALPFITPGTVDAAATISPGVCLSSLPSGESDPSVMLDFAPGENRFVLDVERFLADIEPLPLFLQDQLDVLSVLAGYAR